MQCLFHGMAGAKRNRATTFIELVQNRVNTFFKGQMKAKDIFIDFDHLWPGDFKISNEVSI